MFWFALTMTYYHLSPLINAHLNSLNQTNSRWAHRPHCVEKVVKNCLFLQKTACGRHIFITRSPQYRLRGNLWLFSGYYSVTINATFNECKYIQYNRLSNANATWHSLKFEKAHNESFLPNFARASS